jgi:hypothetical protein
VSRLAYPSEPFADVARRLNLLARVICAQEWIGENNVDEAVGLLADLEDELHRAIRENQALEEAA